MVPNMISTVIIPQFCAAYLHMLKSYRKQSLRLMADEIATQFEISVINQIFLKEFVLKPPRTH